MGNVGHIWRVNHLVRLCFSSIQGSYIPRVCVRQIGAHYTLCTFFYFFIDNLFTVQWPSSGPFAKVMMTVEQ